MHLDPDLVARIDRVFADRVASGTTPSSVWGVFDADGLVATGGHGDRGDGRVPDADTVYRIASCTKSVVAAALLVLVDRGAVQLDQPITDFVPAFDAVVLPAADAPVPTVRMLLTMSGGLPTDDPWADRQEPVGDDDLDAVLRGGLLFDSIPGTRFAYSNLGYALLGRVVAVASGEPFRDFATRTVLDPLGLDATRFAADDERGFVVTGNRPHDGGWEPLPLSGPGAFSPIGGLFSTVADLSRWARYLARAWSPYPPVAPQTPAGSPTSAERGTSAGPGTAAEPGTAPSTDVSPLTPAARRLMQQAHRHIPATALPGSSRPTGYGYGLFVEDDPTVGTIASHSGGYPGFSAHMRWSVTTGLGVVAFENATQAKVSVAAESAHDLLLGAARADDGVPARPRVLPETIAAQRAVRRLLADWRDDDADRVFTPNVALDVPYERRRAAIAAAAERVGADPSADPVRQESSTPTHLRWWVPGSRGELRIEIRLAPMASGLVQTLGVVPLDQAA